MNKISTFTKNPFFTIEVGREDKQKFSYDHIQRFKAAGKPAFLQAIADTEAKWTNIFGSLVDYDKFYNEQQSYSKQMVATMKLFVTKVIKMEPHVLIVFDKASGPYQEFYPFGKTEYHKITQANITILLERMIAVTLKYAVELGGTWNADYTTMKTDFDAIFALQKGSKGSVDLTVTDYEAKETALFNQMYKNIGVIIGEYFETPTTLLSFFDETIVNYVVHSIKVLVPKSSSIAADVTFTAEDTLEVTSQYDQMLTFYFAPESNSPPTGTIYNLAPNSTVVVPETENGAPTNKFIIFVNENLTDAIVKILKV